MLKFVIKVPRTWAPASTFVGDIEAKFYAEAGKLIVKKIQYVLGQAGLYDLDPSYARIKPTLPGYRRVPGKAADQPLIKTAAMYDALSWRIEGDSVVVEVDDSKAHDPKTGFDYAEHWEEVTQYLEKGFALAEPLLPALLEKIIVKEMRWAFVS